jgi:hypothetical protein
MEGGWETNEEGRTSTNLEMSPACYLTRLGREDFTTRESKFEDPHHALGLQQKPGTIM